MNTLVHADLFFFVTTIAVVVVSAALTIVLIYLAKVLSDLKKITGQVHDETVLFREDVRDLRNHVRREGFKLHHFLDFVAKLVKKRTSRSKK